jgi:hypothetical protein
MNSDDASQESNEDRDTRSSTEAVASYNARAHARLPFRQRHRNGATPKCPYRGRDHRVIEEGLASHVGVKTDEIPAK